MSTVRLRPVRWPHLLSTPCGLADVNQARLRNVRQEEGHALGKVVLEID